MSKNLIKDTKKIFNTSNPLLNSKADIFVTPEDYGAVGDGSTNDATAIQNAVNSGYPVWFKDKNYRVNSAISIPDNTFLFGMSSTIISTTSNIAIFDITGSNINIQNITFQGNSTGASQIGIRAVGNAGFTLYRVNIKVTNCTFTLLGGFGMYSQYMIGYSTGTEHQGSFYCTNCFFYNNNISIGLYERGEYNTFVNCVISKGNYGLVINGGNNNFIGGSITNCTQNGVTLGTGVNDGHGVISGTKINHNTWNVSSTGIVTNFTFNSCMIYAGTVYVATSSGIKFFGCEFNTATFTLTNNTILEFNGCKFTVLASTYTLTGTPPVYNNCYHLDGRKIAAANVAYNEKTTFSSNGTFSIPAMYSIESIVIQNTTANAVTGGIKIGTTNGGTEVIVAQAVAGNDLLVVKDATILKNVFSSTVATTLYIQAVTSWNSASLDFYIKLKPFV